MFVLKTERTFSWPVNIKVPTDGGQFATATFDCTFKLIDVERLKATALEDDKFLKEVIVSWAGVEDSNGQALPFSEDARDKMIGIPYVRTALVAAYQEALSGARRKN